MCGTKLAWRRRGHMRFFSLAAAVLVVLSIGVAAWVQQIRIAAARSADL